MMSIYKICSNSDSQCCRVVVITYESGSERQIDESWKCYEVRSVEKMATLSMDMGGLTMSSASRGARAAYWTSWSDALLMISLTHTSSD